MHAAADVSLGQRDRLSSTASASGPVALDISRANVFDLIASGNFTLTFTGTASADKPQKFRVYISDDGVTRRTITFPGSVTWLGTTPSNQTTVARRLFEFSTINGGSTWSGVELTASAAGSFSGDATTIQGKAVSSTAPTGNQTWKFNAGADRWEPATVTTGMDPNYVYVEDYGWSSADTAGTTNRSAMRDAVKHAYDLIAAGVPHVTITWSGSAGINYIMTGTGSQVVDAGILGSFSPRAAIVLDSHMTLKIPTWIELRFPSGYNDGLASGVHRYGIVSTSLASGYTSDVHVICDGIINIDALNDFNAAVDKVTAISITACINSVVASPLRCGIIKNWKGLNGGSLEAWGTVHNNCVNAEVFGVHYANDDGHYARTGAASQYSSGYHVHDVIVSDLTGQGISSYQSRGIDFHDFDIYGVDANGVNLEFCDDYDIHDGISGRAITSNPLSASNPGATQLDMATTTDMGATSLPAGTITLTSAAHYPVSGTVEIVNNAGTIVNVAYTGKSGNNLTGCTGGSGTIGTGNAVRMTLPVGTIYVTDATKFRSAGILNVVDAYGVTSQVTYTGKTSTTFTGCTGGTTAVSTGNVTQAQGNGYGVYILGNGGGLNGTGHGKIRGVMARGNVTAGIGIQAVYTDTAAVGTTSKTIVPTSPATYCKLNQVGLWVRVGAASNPLVKVVSVAPDTSFTTDTPHGGTSGDTIYMFAQIVDIENCELRENQNGGIHLAHSGANCLAVQQHAVRIDSQTRFIDNVGAKDIRGVTPAAGSANWTGAVPVSISGGSVTQIATPVVTLGEYVWNWSMRPIEYEFDFSGITAGAGSGLIKFRAAGILGATTNKADLDRTIVNAAADYAKLPTRFTLRLNPGDAVIFLGGGTGFSAAPTIVSQRNR